MATRPGITERIPLENVEVEYMRPGAPHKVRRPGFNRARLLDVTENGLEIAAREAFPKKEKVQITLHIKTVRNFVKLEGIVTNSPRIMILKQPAFGVEFSFEDLSPDQKKKLDWVREQFVPRRSRQAPIRRLTEDGEDEAGAEGATVAVAPAAATTVAAPPSTTVQRPVALLQLIDRLEKLQVTDDLIMAILEAAEAGMDVEVLYPVKEDEQAAEEEEEEEESSAQMPPAEGQARPMNVYRLGRKTRLHFSEKGTPVGPPAELFYLSRLKSPETCFALELGLDTMTQEGAPGFSRGAILVFDGNAAVSSGDFAFVKLRTGDLFGQVFIDKPEEVRLRMINSKYPERVLRRTEVKMLCKLIGHYEELKHYS